MINHPNSVPPSEGNKTQGPNNPEAAESKPKNKGTYEFTSEHKFLGMTFTAKDWTKLMNIMLNNMNNYINDVFQKMTKKLKKDWARSRGDNSED